MNPPQPPSSSGQHHAWHHEVPPEAEGSSVEAPILSATPSGDSAGSASSAASGSSGTTGAPSAPAPSPARVVAVIAVGGFLGGPTRYLLGQAFPTAARTFPVTTFAINVSGSFILAVLLVCVIEVWPPTRYVRPFGAVGFLGAYTTFSTWMVDTDRLMAAGRYGFAALNVFGSLFSGLVATALGIFLARAVLVRRSPGWSRA
ncbi:fluoride efflux transporter FluC [Catenulispora rubra]|uniref:fluoride efflux transporter FluC n=1 Tax=Catenulispora rubra TaxID=280293 RepID=UPI002B26BCCC|nr:CrcB family protein [Catenulispora rubra]